MGEECLLIVPSFALSDAATRQAAEQELSAAAQNNYVSESTSVHHRYCLLK